MKQPIKGQGKIKRKKPKLQKKWTPFTSTNHGNQEYGTSQLERDFAHDFLEKNGIKFIYQFEAKEIKRYFDFAIISNGIGGLIMEEKDGLKSVRQQGQESYISFLIEIDGSYFHADPRVVGEKKLNSMQKHSQFVDKLKDQYAGMHCVPLLRVWEYDIRHNPDLVLENLRNYIAFGDKKRKINECTFIGDKLKDYIKNTYLSNGYPWGKLFNNKIIKNNAIRFKKIKVYEDLLFFNNPSKPCS